MIFRRLAMYTWAVKRSRWARLALENKTGSSKLSLKQPHFPLPCIPPEIRLSLSLESWWLLLFSKNHFLCSISFCHIIQGNKYSVAETVPKGSLSTQLGKRWTLYIQKLSITQQRRVSADPCELYVFLCPGRVARKLPSQYATFHVLGTLSILLHLDMLLNIRPNKL